MPLQNRVTPEGQIVADAHRGLMMGNRGGALHDAARQIGRRTWVSRQWIACRLEFNNRKRTVMTPGRYTELFFLDEATALAAGHRPCFECRRQEALRFATLWAAARGGAERASAGDMDAVLHRERLAPDGGKRTWTAPIASLPSGVMVRRRSRSWLLLSGRLHEWSQAGYLQRDVADPSEPAEVLTPPSIVAVLSAGYAPMLHPTVGRHR